MLVCPHLALFVSLLSLLHVCWLHPLFVACTRMEQGHDSQDTSKKGKDASPKREIFIKLGGIAPPKWFSLSLSFLAYSLEHVLRFPSMYPLYFSCSLLGLYSRYGNVCFTFLVPCWAIPLERWQCLLYFLTLCDSIVYDVCISIYACACVGNHALCMKNSRGYLSDPL